MKQLSQSKDALDISVKHNFIDPVQIVVDQNIKDVQVEASFFMPPLLSSAVLSVLNMVNQQAYSFYNLYEMSSSQSWLHLHLPLQHHLKKMEGRRLDYDYKKKRQGKIPDEEIQVAHEKFNESKELSGKSMVSLLELDVSSLCFCVHTEVFIIYSSQTTHSHMHFEIYYSEVGKSTHNHF